MDSRQISLEVAGPRLARFAPKRGAVTSQDEIDEVMSRIENETRRMGRLVDELLRRAVDNLLTNVLTHTPRDTAASITASCTQNTITIEVRDDGPGVPADTLPHLFERFYRAAGGAAVPGSGLGLAIAAEVAAAHGGAATAGPVSPHGLSIKLSVPARQDLAGTRPSVTRAAVARAAAGGSLPGLTAGT